MKKRLLSLTLVLLLMCALTVPASAGDKNPTTKTNEYGICQGSSITLDRNYCLSTEYNFYVVGVDPKAPVVSYKAAIPELSELVLFSNDVCGSYQTSKVTDVVTNKQGELEIKRDVVTVYEFPVGTVMKLTDDAKAEYSLTNITDLADDDYCVKELTIKEASMREKTYFVNSENDPEGATFYIRGVNLNSNFADVADDAYYKDPVKWAVRYGVTNGTSTTRFSPNQTCTTAQILTFLWRAKGSPEPTFDNLFTDVKSTDYYSKAAHWACEQGLISSGQLNGNSPCTRGMTVTYLWRLAGSPDVGESSFADAGQYSRAVEWAVKQGITKGTSATAFSPDATCTRGQIMTFLYRAMA